MLRVCTGKWKTRTLEDADTNSDTDNLMHFYIYITVISYLNAVFTAAFASRPLRRSCPSAYLFISACANNRLAIDKVVHMLLSLIQL